MINPSRRCITEVLQDFGVACTKLEIACKILPALQHDCKMEACRKFQMYSPKMPVLFLCKVKNYLQVSVISFGEIFIYRKNQIIVYFFGCSTKFSIHHRKIFMHGMHYNMQSKSDMWIHFIHFRAFYDFHKLSSWAIFHNWSKIGLFNECGLKVCFWGRVIVIKFRKTQCLFVSTCWLIYFRAKNVIFFQKMDFLYKIFHIL